MLGLYQNRGKAIMEIQQGDERASYGETVLEKLSQKLTAEFGKGFSKRNLERMRKFYMRETINSRWSVRELYIFSKKCLTYKF